MSDEVEHDGDGGGAQVEKWILRLLLLGVLGALIAQLVHSMDDIQRYRRMQEM